MKTTCFAFCLLLTMSSYAQPEANIEKVTTNYQGKTVKARRLTVRSEIPMPLSQAWAHVQTPALLEFVAKGMIRFKPVENPLPARWEAGETYAVKMRLWGFLPFGGTHYLQVETIDPAQHHIATREWDRRAKIWNHEITLRDLGNGRVAYEDRILIYGGALTGFITQFAQRFYRHRQSRWQLVAKEGMQFGSP